MEMYFFSNYKKLTNNIKNYIGKMTQEIYIDKDDSDR